LAEDFGGVALAAGIGVRITAVRPQSNPAQLSQPRQAGFVRQAWRASGLTGQHHTMQRRAAAGL
jgi:hypothetical protein